MERRIWRAAVAGLALVAGTSAADILKTSGFTTCNGDTDITVQKTDISYDNSAKVVTFDVAGTSAKEQKVRAMLNVTAYGNQVYSNAFNPCDNATFVEQLCPVPAGAFAAKGTQAIPAQYANMVPAIAFQVPDIAAQATLQLFSLDTDENVACITSQVTNGKTTSIPAVTYVAAAVAGGAMLLAGAGAVGSAIASGGASVGGVGTPSPSFFEVVTWFQGMAMNGMSSANLPPVYRNFAKNFGFSAGLIPWNTLQLSIDNFRSKTGGNVSADGVQYLQNATLVFADNSTDNLADATTKFRRGMANLAEVLSRDISTSVNGTSSDNSSSGVDVLTHRINAAGIQAYVEELSIPSANTFMTVLLIVAIVIAAIAVGILLVKVILEAWALFGNFPKALTGFRKHYWGSIARAITNLILLLYGVWVLYCIFQFTHGDSWAAKALAGVTLALFTAILAFFSYKIWSTAHKLKAAEGDASRLYDDKDIWVKYSLFYDSYRKDYWWIFVPTILYMFAKGCCLAAADGHGMAQTIAQLVIETLMLVLLLWARPYERKAGNWINVVIQVVRVLSVVCILVFVEEFGISQTTQTVTGVVLIAVQSALTGLLAILLAANAIIACCKENPHRKRRKELEKMRDLDTLTPLDARNDLLLERKLSHASSNYDDTLKIQPTTMTTETTYNRAAAAEAGINTNFAANEYTQHQQQQHTRNASNSSYRPLAITTQSAEHLTANAAAPGMAYGGGGGVYGHERTASPAAGMNGYRQGPYGQGGYGGAGASQRPRQDVRGSQGGGYYGYRY